MTKTFALFLAPLIFLGTTIPLGAETAAEQWVRAQVKAGKEADLSKNPTGRVLSAEFLTRLLGTKTGFVDAKGIAVSHGIVKERLDLERLDATYDVELKGFEFHGPVILSGAHFKRSLMLGESVFEQELIGYRLQVDTDLSIGPIVSNGHVDRRTSCNGPVNLTYAVIGGGLNAHYTDFEDAVMFSGVRVGSRGQFLSSTFLGEAVFTQATFTGEVNFTSAMFYGNANFNSMTIGYVAIFDNASFGGDGDFRHMHIAINFQATGMRFNNPLRSARFSDMKVGTKFRLEKTSMNQGYVQMVRLSAAEMELHGVTWPTKSRFECEDVSYERIAVYEGGNPGLSTWPERSRYSSSVYASLARYLDAHGDPTGAADVRVDRQWREAEILDPPHKLWNRLKFLTCAYGERPWYAFVWIGAFVAIGCLVFPNKTVMELTDLAKPDPGYNAFWYSLGLFLPVVDIGLIKAWRPKQTRQFAPHYAQIHVLLGWVFVPIALASITGLLK